MSAATVNYNPANLTWNGDSAQRTEFKYSQGFYSRAERTFVGFADVLSTRIWDASTVEEQYATDDVYWKGLLKKRIERDGPIGTGKVFDVLQITRSAPVALDTSPRPSEPAGRASRRTT